MLAGIAHRTFLAKYDIEFRMKICLFIGSICFTLFCLSYNHLFLLAIVTFILNCCAGSMEVLVNVNLVAAKGDIKSNSNFSYALYGVGGMLGPIIVALLGIHILLTIAI